MKIKGKEYFYHTGTSTKVHAEKIKRLRKQKGDKVRIVKTKYKGKTHYEIWIG
jgi:hypothetical protein